MNSQLRSKLVERTLWAMWWLLLVVSSFWLMIGSVSYWVRNGYLPADASGWVQAVGAVVAIGVALVIPLYQRAHEQESRRDAARELEFSRSEQLLSLCEEAYTVVTTFDAEAAFADYFVSNDMRRAMLNDLLNRLNAAQIVELNPERLAVGVQLRQQLHDWMKYFGGDEIDDVGRLHDRVEARTWCMDKARVAAGNVLRGMRGQPLRELPTYQSTVDDDPPW